MTTKISLYPRDVIDANPEVVRPHPQGHRAPRGAGDRQDLPLGLHEPVGRGGGGGHPQGGERGVRPEPHEHGAHEPPGPDRAHQQAVPAPVIEPKEEVIKAAINGAYLKGRDDGVMLERQYQKLVFPALMFILGIGMGWVAFFIVMAGKL
jgi:hypothetical protein